MPILPPSSLNGTFSLPVAVTMFQQRNVSALNFISDLLTRNNDARLSSEMTGVQIKNLIRTTEANTGVWSNRCPFELLIALTILTFAVLYLCRQLLWLRARMVAHERLALQVFSTPPHRSRGGKRHIFDCLIPQQILCLAEIAFVIIFSTSPTSTAT